MNRNYSTESLVEMASMFTSIKKSGEHLFGYIKDKTGYLWEPTADAAKAIAMKIFEM